MLKILDKLEKHPIYYERTLGEIEMVDSKVTDFKAGDTVDCGIYLLKNFKDHLLDLPFLDNYDSEADPTKPYDPP